MIKVSYRRGILTEGLKKCSPVAYPEDAEKISYLRGVEARKTHRSS